MKGTQPDNAGRYPFMKRLRDVAVVASAELVASKTYQKFILGVTAAGLVFEWGPGNEWLIGGVGSETHSSFDPTNGFEFVASSAAAGAAAGAVSALEQGALGTLMSGSVRAFPETFTKWDDTRKHEPINPDKGDLALGIVLGTSAVVIEKNSQNPDRTFVDDLKLTGKTSAGIGIANTALVTGASLGVRAVEDLGYESVAQGIEDVLKNPLAYIAAFGIYKTHQIIKARMKRNKDTLLDSQEVNDKE